MSSFSWMHIGLFVLGTYFFILWYKWIRHWYIGFGVGLMLRESDGTVWITSRINSSPLHKYKIESHTRLLSVNGMLMQFDSSRQYLNWLKSNKTKRGVEETWVVANSNGDIVATMMPQLIRCCVPSYWNPNQREETPGERRNPHIKRGIGICTSTGEFVFTRTPSDYALNQIMGFTK